jgi:hypothetical protein
MIPNAKLDCRQYLAEWTSLTSLLTPSGSSGRFVPGMNERQQLKDCATSFFDRLVELEAACTQWSLSRQDPDLRDRLGKDVGELVGGAYGAFWGRCQGKGVEKCEYDELPDGRTESADLIACRSERDAGRGAKKGADDLPVMRTVGWDVEPLRDCVLASSQIILTVYPYLSVMSICNC